MRKLLVGILLLLTSHFAFAGYGCKGEPKVIAIWKQSGMLGLKLEGHDRMWLICDLESDAGCNAALSLALAAKARKAVVQINFLDHLYSSCEEMPSWTNVSTSFDHISEL